MKSLSSFTTESENLIQPTQKSSNTIKDDFVHIGGKLDGMTNQRSDTVSIDPNHEVMRYHQIKSYHHHVKMPPLSIIIFIVV